jgi:hypothetical protein
VPAVPDGAPVPAPVGGVVDVPLAPATMFAGVELPSPLHAATAKHDNAAQKPRILAELFEDFLIVAPWRDSRRVRVPYVYDFCMRRLSHVGGRLLG